MTALLITGHGNFATGLKSALKLIAGEHEHIIAVDFEVQHSTDDLLKNLKAAIEGLDKSAEVLVFSDIAGGSPFKMASELKLEYKDRVIEIVAGTNLLMLIEAFMRMSGQDSAPETAKSLVEIGKSQVLHLELKEHVDDLGEDGI